MRISYAEDCVHLKACRRLSKIARAEVGYFSRGCTEKCSAYYKDDGTSYVSVEGAVEYAADGVSYIRSGYDTYDVYCPGDLDGMTLSEIINGED